MPDWPAPLAFDHGWPEAGMLRGKYNHYGPAPNHNGTKVYLAAEWHVEKTSNMWPYDKDRLNEKSQRYKFHPRRDRKGSGPGGI